MSDPKASEEGDETREVQLSSSQNLVGVSVAGEEENTREKKEDPPLHDGKHGSDHPENEAQDTEA